MLGKIAVAFMTFIIVVIAGFICEDDDDMNTRFIIVVSLAIAVMMTLILAQNGVV